MIGQNFVELSKAQCGNFRIFLFFRFFVKLVKWLSKITGFSAFWIYCIWFDEKMTEHSVEITLIYSYVPTNCFRVFRQNIAIANIRSFHNVPCHLSRFYVKLNSVYSDYVKNCHFWQLFWFHENSKWQKNVKLLTLWTKYFKQSLIEHDYCY